MGSLPPFLVSQIGTMKEHSPWNTASHVSFRGGMGPSLRSLFISPLGMLRETVVFQGCLPLVLVS